jgi:hypothetical protein
MRPEKREHELLAAVHAGAAAGPRHRERRLVCAHGRRSNERHRSSDAVVHRSGSEWLGRVDRGQQPEPIRCLRRTHRVRDHGAPNQLVPL